MDLMGIRRRILMQIGRSVKMIEAGAYTPSEDVLSSQTHIQHSLNVVPDFIMVVADQFECLAEYTNRYIANSYCAKTNLISSGITSNSQGFEAYLISRPGVTSYQSFYETVNPSKFLHETSFEVPYYNSSDMLKAGITYHYVIGTFD